MITGAAGFIGSAVYRHLLTNTDACSIIVDKLTYAAALDVAVAAANPRTCVECVDVADSSKMTRVFLEHRPNYVMHLAAESHVDRSIVGPGAFIQTNVVGTYVLLEAARNYWSQLPIYQREAFRFHHVSTDEVFGSLGPSGAFREDSPYEPKLPVRCFKGIQ